MNDEIENNFKRAIATQGGVHILAYFERRLQDRAREIVEANVGQLPVLQGKVQELHTVIKQIKQYL